MLTKDIALSVLGFVIGVVVVERLFWSLRRATETNVPSPSPPPTLPVCLPSELTKGVWSERWISFSQCERWQWKDSRQVDRDLFSTGASFIWSGNSIKRHIFLRFADQRTGVKERFGGKLDGNLNDYDREKEKQLCRKDVRVDSNRTYSNHICGASCCGACSCMNTIASVSQFFTWQQEWFSQDLAKIWMTLIQDQLLKSKKVFLLLNAGLIFAWKEAEKSLVRLRSEGEQLISFLASLPDSVRVIYLSSTNVDEFEQDVWMAAQDGLLQLMFNSMPPGKRPVWVDLRGITYAFVDFKDQNHFTGRPVDVIIDVLMHIFVNWDQLYCKECRGYQDMMAVSRRCRTSASTKCS
jgi:hypothetical protein